MATCRYCGRRIEWVHTLRGNIAVDPLPRLLRVDQGWDLGFSGCEVQLAGALVPIEEELRAVNLARLKGERLERVRVPHEPSCPGRAQMNADELNHRDTEAQRR